VQAIVFSHSRELEIYNRCNRIEIDEINSV